MENDLIEEIKGLFEEDSVGWYLEDHRAFEVMDTVLESFSAYGGDATVVYVFKYKDKLFSIPVTQDSYGNVEDHIEDLKEVFSKEITKTIYE